MRPLLSTSQSLGLDAFTRELLEFSTDNLMEIAAMRLWEKLKHEVIQKWSVRLHSEASRALESEASISAVCGKGDNAGDALAVLRHAKLEGFQHLSAFVPAPDTLKESVRLNLRRAERCGIQIVCYENAEEAAVLETLARQDFILDAILGTGVRGCAKGSAARAMQMLGGALSKAREQNDSAPCVVSIDIPSGLSDDWLPDYPIVRADATLCMEPMKEALYMPAARPFGGDIIPVGGIFPLWASQAASAVWLLEDSDVREYLPPVSRWAHKMQRGRVAILAGSPAGSGAAVHCVRGAAAAGAGYIALYCDQAMFSSYLTAAGDVAIVRALSESSFSPDSWDAVVVGPGWGIDEEREAILDKLLQYNTPLVLDADAVRLFAKIANRSPDSPRFFKAPLILTPHPGELRDLRSLLGREAIRPSYNTSETVGELISLAETYGLVLALRASTTHIAFPDGTCAVFDGSVAGLGVAGSGDVLSGLVGGLLARWTAISKEEESGGADEDTILFHSKAARALAGAVLVHGSAGRELSKTAGWFTPVELAHACARITSANDQG